VNLTMVSDKRESGSQLLPAGFPVRVQHILPQVNLLPNVNMCVTLRTSQETVRRRIVRIKQYNNRVLQLAGSTEALDRY